MHACIKNMNYMFYSWHIVKYMIHNMHAVGQDSRLIHVKK